MQKRITKIPPKSAVAKPRKRVAAYCRVTGARDEQLLSLSTQVSYYNKLIQERVDWEFAGVFADESLTGTKQDRPQLQRLMVDCRAGIVDMVITKAISRFARNTVTTLKYVRELRELGISVYFEEENIDTLSEGGELMLTVLSAFAQEQSFNVSQDCKWRIEKQFQKGEMPMNQQRLYGYKRTNDGGYEIVEDEAEVVRWIYNRYLEGAGLTVIVRELKEKNTPRSLSGKWSANGIRYILSNEKFIGDLRLQKEYTDDHISKRKVINRGGKPQYYVENNHAAIIPREIFSAVQGEIARRARQFKASDEPQKTYPLSGKIVCGICGRNFKRRTNPTKITWQCGTYTEHGKTVCSAKQIPDSVLTDITADKNIRIITALPDNILRLELSDGTVTETRWQDRSRRESWTPEMRQAARNKRLQQIERGRDK
jgi:DNA invertase Pin-like site-specific DNA recombinase